jgi:heat shock protein HslJ
MFSIALNALYVASLLATTSAAQQPQVPVQIPRSSSMLTQTVWYWERSEYSDDSVVPVADPSRYTITLLPDQRLNIRADCNSGGGTYTVNGAQLTLQLGPMTLIACPPGSQDSTFLRDLGQVATYVLTDEQLVLNLSFDSGNMVFSANVNVNGNTGCNQFNGALRRSCSFGPPTSLRG